MAKKKKKSPEQSKAEKQIFEKKYRNGKLVEGINKTLKAKNEARKKKKQKEQDDIYKGLF